MFNHWLGELKMAARVRKEVDTSTYIGRFGRRLKMLREKAGLSVEELAIKSGIPDKTLYAWEGGTRTAGIDRLPNLAESLGVKTKDLLPNY